MSIIQKSIEKYTRLDLQITNEIEGNQNELIIRKLDHDIAQLHSSIAEMRPVSDIDSMLQIRFFLNLASRGVELSSDIKIAKQLITKNIAHSSFHQLKGRISLIDSEFKYEKTTADNQVFYQDDKREIVGRHVAEVIGEKRFEKRARQYLELAFSGECSEYFHLQNAPEGEKVMRCTMEPYKAEKNGAIVTMLDVTSEMQNYSKTKLCNLQGAY